MSSDRKSAATRFKVRVIPGAAREEFAGLRGSAVVVRLTAPPVEGAANKELVDMLSETLAVPARDISIVSGQRSRNKTIRVAGLSAAEVKQHLQEAGAL